MTFLQTKLTDLKESDIVALKGVAESLTLEFKRELNIDRDDEKSEAAKDVSALANTLGGRLLYGVDEAKRDKGENVATDVVAMQDRSIPSRLADVLNSLLSPRVQLNMQSVEVAGGFVLVLEIQPSTGLDLHMVLDSKGGRFYRRGTKGNVPLREPEVREAYTRIIEHRASLNERTQRAIDVEAFQREDPGTSFFVVPLFARENLVDPRILGDLRADLAYGPLVDMDLAAHIDRLQFAYDGYRTKPAVAGDPRLRIYVAILKTGVVHFHRAAATSSDSQLFSPAQAARDCVQVMAIANHVLEAVGYFGDVRCVHRLRAGLPWRIDHLTSAEHGAARDFRTECESINLSRTIGAWGRAVKDLIDPYYQEFGWKEAPFFADDGTVPLDHHMVFRSQFERYLQITRPAVEKG